jgi:hypothetical protein
VSGTDGRSRSMTMTATKPESRWILTPTADCCGWLDVGGTVYCVRVVESDWAVLTCSVRKELVQADGSVRYASGYTVTVPQAGVSGRSQCQCQGFRRWGGCRHTNAIKTLVAKELAKVAA